MTFDLLNQLLEITNEHGLGVTHSLVDLPMRIILGNGIAFLAHGFPLFEPTIVHLYEVVTNEGCGHFFLSRCGTSLV